MKRSVYLCALAVSGLGVAVVAIGGAQTYPVRLDERQAETQPAGSTSPSLVLADGGLQFSDGTVQTTAATGLALVPRTGQTTCYDVDGNVVPCGTGIGLEQDGDLQLGVTWPNPRFTDHGNGTVTDNLTGLTWLDDADCSGNETWANALAKAAALFDGCSDCGGTNNDCGLADDSIVGQWRLPNLRELQSLVHNGFSNPALPNTSGTGQWSEGDPFTSVASLFSYWSSTTDTSNTTSAWTVGLSIGDFGTSGKTGSNRVWPVSGGQMQVHLDPKSVELQPAALTPPALVLADGGLQFPDGSVQTTAAAGGAQALVPQTGQSTVYATGDDGDLQLGVTWPSPRFTDNLNGTVTDNLTGLIWLQDANCFNTEMWAAALTKAAALFDGCSDCGGTNNDCGLTDDSIVGQWRLPNLRELQGLAHYGFSNPALPNTAGTGQWVEGDPFTGVVSSSYWVSSTDTFDTTRAWNAGLFEGGLATTAKTGGNYVWPVRGGQ